MTTSSLSERRPVYGARRPIIRPVSQVTLSLSDQAAFPAAVRAAVEWMNARSRCDGAIPRDALEGMPFDLAHDVGAIPAAADLFSDREKKTWAAKLDFPDREVGQRTWSTEISVSKLGATTRFAARLTNITRSDDPPYAPSIPGIVQTILTNLSAEVDEFPVTEDVFRVSEEELSDFEFLLLRKDRSLPIVATSSAINGNSTLDTKLATRRLAGAAHIVHLTPEASWQLTRTYGRQYSAFGGATRIYWPNFNPDEDNQHRHPLKILSDNFDQEEYIEWLCHTILPRPFVRSKESDIVRIIDVKNLNSKRSREDISESSKVSELIEAVRNLEQDLAATELQRHEDAEAAQALLDEASESRVAAEQRRDELAQENEKLTARIRALANRSPTQIPPQATRLVDFSNFEAWVDENMGDHIRFTSRAIRSAEKFGTQETKERIESSLLLLRDYYVPMRMGQANSTLEEFRRKCQEVGIEESARFSIKNDIRKFSGYRAQIGSRTIWLDRHLKFGNGYDLRRMFRIYFAWDEQTQTLIIGHLPTHLDNNVTD